MGQTLGTSVGGEPWRANVRVKGNEQSQRGKRLFGECKGITLEAKAGANVRGKLLGGAIVGVELYGQSTWGEIWGQTLRVNVRGKHFGQS